MRLISHTAVLFLFLVFPGFCLAQQLELIQLPEPQMEGGRPLMEVLRDRMSTRQFSGKELSSQTLSDLLWAAFGINRPDLGKRTAPSARNWQETDIYVALTQGLYVYNAQAHVLEPILSEDIRSLTGQQPYVGEAPVNLVYVADFSRMEGASEKQKVFLSGADTGLISQNVYLYCASEGLATVVRGLVDRSALAKKMDLRPEQKITLAQCVGYPRWSLFQD